MPPSDIPPPAPPETLLLVARWIGWLEKTPDDGYRGLRHAYALAVRPDELIATGRVVRLLAVSSFPPYAPASPIKDIEMYDPHFVGQVEEIWTADSGMAQARVRNLCCGNRVREVVLEFPQLLSARTRNTRRAPEKWSAVETEEMGLVSLTCVRPSLMRHHCAGASCWLGRWSPSYLE